MNPFLLTGLTNRLEIRPYVYQDYLNWLTEYQRREPSKHRYDEGKIDMSVCTEQWFYDLVNHHQSSAKQDTLYVFGVFRKQDGAHLGVIDVSTLMREDFHWGRIGYSIHNHYWGHGYGSEAVLEALRIAHKKLNYHRIEAHINLDNHASIALAKRVGMEYECVRKGFIYEFGEWTDNLVYVSQPHRS